MSTYLGEIASHRKPNFKFDLRVKVKIGPKHKAKYKFDPKHFYGHVALFETLKINYGSYFSMSQYCLSGTFETMLHFKSD